MEEKKTPVVESAEDRKKWRPIEYVGLIVFILFQKQIYSGITSGAVKG